MESLRFSRPQDVYTEGNMLIFDKGRPYLLMKLIEEAPHLGPGTSWFRGKFGVTSNMDNAGALMPRSPYPTLLELGSCLEGMPHLKHLRIPSDMYDISVQFILSLARNNQALEHIEFCFDYNDKVRYRHCT